MFPVGVAVFVVAEVAALVAVASRIGVLDAVGLLIVVSLSGPWLVRRTGLGVWRRAVERVGSGQAPDREVIDGLLLFLAGLLICVPGFITDAVGIALLLPPVRAVVRRRIGRGAARTVVARFGGVGAAGAGAPQGRAARWLGGQWDGGDVVDAGSHQAARGPLPEPGVDRPGSGSGSGFASGPGFATGADSEGLGPGPESDAGAGAG